MAKVDYSIQRSLTPYEELKLAQQQIERYREVLSLMQCTCHEYHHGWDDDKDFQNHKTHLDYCDYYRAQEALAGAKE